ncbi:MAG TPA: hypothetical protein DCG33_00440 [Prevotellaceae bacterium]|nr:hypothetical protein [Prevotellaceae bacterium]
MDYTKVPRALIYLDITDIGEFGIDDESSLMGAFCSNLLDQTFMREQENSPEILLDIFNNAFYICTLICLEKRPRLYLPKYIAIASNNYKDDDWQYNIMPTTMALVYSLLVCCGFFSEEDKFMKSISDYFENEDLYGDTESHDIFFNQIITSQIMRTIKSHKIPGRRIPMILKEPIKFQARGISSLYNVDSHVKTEDYVDGADYLLQGILDGKYDDTERQRLLELQAGCVKVYLGNANVLLTKTERNKTFDALRKLQEVYEKFGMKWIPPYSADVFSDSNTDQTLLEAVIAEKENNVDFSSLEERIKELEEENERLSKENEELKEIKMIMDTPLDAIEADSKVGLTEILKLMVNDGANFAKHNNKTIASKALKMMTGRSESACKQIFSSPLSPTYSGHKNKISELNGYLKALGMKTLL